jgi:hypothetical protein
MLKLLVFVCAIAGVFSIIGGVVDLLLKVGAWNSADYLLFLFANFFVAMFVREGTKSGKDRPEEPSVRRPDQL